MFFIVAEDVKGNKKVKCYYNQWGIGRIMPSAAMRAILTNEDRAYGLTALDACTFDHTKGSGWAYLGSQTVSQDSDLGPDFFAEIADRKDNNNGAMVLFATDIQVPGRYTIETDYHIGFLLGTEDEGQVPSLGKAWGRWLSLFEWSRIPVNADYCTEDFRTWFRGFMREWGVTEIAK